MRSAAPTSSSSRRAPPVRFSSTRGCRRAHTSTRSEQAAPPAWEIDVETVAASALFADSRESLQNEAGEFRLAVEEGAITGIDHVRGEIGELLIDQAPGRQDDTELTLFRSLGIAVEDLAAAEHAVAAARRLGLGTEVEM